MRLINADELLFHIERLPLEAYYVDIDKVEDLIKSMPTIETIPISWIERFITSGVYGVGRIEDDSIRFMVEMWRKEQKRE